MNKRIQQIIGISVLIMAVMGIFASVLAVDPIPIDSPPIPTNTQAINCGGATGPDKALCNVLSTMGIILAILQIGVIMFFIWSIAKYLTAGGDSEKMKVARNTILWSLIVLAAVFGVTLLINYIFGYLGITGTFSLPIFGAV